MVDPTALLPLIRWLSSSASPGEAALFRELALTGVWCDDAVVRDVARDIMERMPSTEADVVLWRSGGDVPLDAFAFGGGTLNAQHTCLVASYTRADAEACALSPADESRWIMSVHVPRGTKVVPLVPFLALSTRVFLPFSSHLSVQRIIVDAGARPVIHVVCSLVC